MRGALGPATPDAVTRVESYVSAHGEYADVTRPRSGEIHVVCFGQDEALPGSVPPRTNVVTASICIPAGATVEVDPDIEVPAPRP
jgi:hypothetical protein